MDCNIRNIFNQIEKDEDYNLPQIYSQLFTIDENIAYMHLPRMIHTEEAPKMQDAFHAFMRQNDVENTQALIIDVRSNSGGGRDLIMALAQYIIHPDSIHIVNVVQQRGEIPLNDDWKRQLHNRYLFAFDELDVTEQKAVNQFHKSFQPMYQLDSTKYSEFYYCIFNGQKNTNKKHYYNKPVYILANERSFSAASVLVAVFKGLHNVTVVGITTDGSSGNSEGFRLPKSNLKVKLSTMVSFQKDGKTLDGYGTAPDIKIERDIEQIFWKKDTQLEKLKAIIKANSK